MIFETTHTNKEVKELINDCLGNPFSLFESIKMGGVGSKRLIIDDVSHTIKSLMNIISDINYGNIEIRPNGIIVMINKGLRNFSWAIPYHQLVIYKTNGLSIHAQGKYIHFKDNKLLKENAKFIKKILDLKAQKTQEFIIPSYE